MPPNDTKLTGPEPTPVKTDSGTKSPSIPVDSVGRGLEVGDVVNVQALVTGISGDTVNLEISNANGDKHSVSSINPGLLTHSGVNPRIGAAPQTRTPVVEVPAENGGVKPVARDEFNKGKTNSVAGLPTPTAEQASKLAAA